MEKLINRIGLDRIAHFGIGGTIFGAFVATFALSMPYGNNVTMSFCDILLIPLTGYIILAFVEFIKEVFIDYKGDWGDILATMLGGMFVHICAIVGYVFHLGNGRDLITTWVGWLIFGIIFGALAIAWILWAKRSLKKK